MQRSRSAWLDFHPDIATSSSRTFIDSCTRLMSRALFRARPHERAADLLAPLDDLPAESAARYREATRHLTTRG